MNHKCYSSPPNSDGHPDWEHNEEPCTCECKMCMYFKFMQSLPEVSDEEVEYIWALLASTTKAPWKNVQLEGMGPNNFIVSDHPDAKWYKVVAKLENAGGISGGDFIAWCREGVPRLLNTIANLQQKLKDSNKQS